MAMKDRLYRNIIKVYPKNARVGLKKLMLYAGEEKKELQDVLAPVIVASVLFAVAAVLFQQNFLPENPVEGILSAISILLLAQLFFYLFYFFKADKRVKKVEEVLPDALQLMASNLNAGMTAFQAMKLAARSEFGPLKEEFDYATTKALGTESFSQALLNVGKRVNSPVLERAMKLISSSLKSGGHLAVLLEDLAEDIAETKSLKNELVTNTKTYSMFIMFTIIVGAPLLLAISIHFVKIVVDMKASANISATEFGIEFMSGAITLTPEFLTKMAVVILFITSLLACMLFGVISSGKEKFGLKFGPMVIAAALVIFFIAKYLVGQFFAGIM
jgi:Flp pilus assembly protein TadB